MDLRVCEWYPGSASADSDSWTSIPAIVSGRSPLTRSKAEGAIPHWFVGDAGHPSRLALAGPVIPHPASDVGERLAFRGRTSPGMRWS